MKVTICVEQSDDRALSWETNLKSVPNAGDVIAIIGNEKSSVAYYKVLYIEWGMVSDRSGESLNVGGVCVFCEKQPEKGSHVTGVSFSF